MICILGEPFPAVIAVRIFLRPQIRLRKGRAVHKRGLGHFLGRGPGDGDKPKSNCAINADQRPKFPLWVAEFGQYRVVDTGLFRPLVA